MPPNSSTSSTNQQQQPPPPRQHGVKGVYHGGKWLDIEDCDGVFTNPQKTCSGCEHETACPRSKSRNRASEDGTTYDILIIGAGCIGASIARELSKYTLKTLLIESADDVSQGATKGNSGIVHAGYDDTPGTNRAKFCWKGNQMFPQLDRELRFGYQLNGSLVLAFSEKERKVLEDLKKRGETNGVKRLRIVEREELREMEPYVREDAIAALYSPDAGNVIPYEFTIALAENAVDNGVELRIRREVTGIREMEGPTEDGGYFEVDLMHWEPKEYVDAVRSSQRRIRWLAHGVLAVCALKVAYDFWLYWRDGEYEDVNDQYKRLGTTIGVLLVSILYMRHLLSKSQSGPKISHSTPLPKLAQNASRAIGTGGSKVTVSDMLRGGSGWTNAVDGIPIETETVTAKFVINCAGGASDEIARMIGDDSFNIKPRLGDYLLLNRNQGHLARHTLFPCPDPVLGKGVLVQTTLWGNLILGPTARDMHNSSSRDMSDASIQQYILSKCKQLVPSFDPKETIHAFCGARAKSDRGDWIIEPSKKNKRVIHVAGIDSPGLAGSPAIALEVVHMLKRSGLEPHHNPKFNPNRAPIIVPKAGMKGLKMGPFGKNDSEGGCDFEKMKSNVICKCEKVTEFEVVRALRRSLPIDSTQAIRKRTRAGMGHCQADPENYDCEARVKAIIARECGVPVEEVGGRPWPATSTLKKRWIDEEDKKELEERMMGS